MAYSAPDTVFVALNTDHEIGDVLAYDGSYYAITGRSDTTVTISGMVLNQFNGAAVIDAYLSPVDIVITRRLATVSSPTSTWGSTRVTATSPNYLGFPASSTYSYGRHTSVVLEGNLEVGSPVRIGDYILQQSDDTKVGVIAGRSQGACQVALDSAYVTIPTEDIYIKSPAAATWEPTISGVNVAQLSANGADLERLLSVFCSSGSARPQVELIAGKLTAEVTVLRSALSEFKFSATAVIPALIRHIREVGATLLLDYFLSLDIASLVSATDATRSYNEATLGALTSAYLELASSSSVELSSAPSVWDSPDDDDEIPYTVVSDVMEAADEQ